MAPERSARALGRVFLLPAMAALLVASSCTIGDDEAGPATTSTTSTSMPSPSTTNATTTPLIAVRLDPEDYPTDPAELGGCPEPLGGESVSLRMPAQLFPSDVQDELAVSNAFSGKSVGGDPADRLGPEFEWSEHLVLTDAADGRVTGELGITSSPYDPQTAGSPRDTTIRGQPAMLKPNHNRGGPTGWTDAYWSEAGQAYSVESIGLSDEELRSLLDRVELSPGGLSDPAGETTKIGEPGYAETPHTAIFLVEAANSVPAVDLSIDHTNGEDRGIHHVADFYHLGPSVLDMQLGQLNGRPAFWGPFPASDTRWSETGKEGVNRVIASTAEGHTVTAIGRTGIEQLQRLVASIEPIEPDDGRLGGVPIGPPDDWGYDTIWCRPDR